MKRSPEKIETLEPAHVSRLLQDGKVLLVDVREATEHADERIHGAMLMPLSTFDPATVPADGARRVVFHCGIGKRSMMAAEKCIAAGRSHAAHMGGGLAAWKAASLPVIKND
jgi:rhodanese-related sulfurtransferase